MDAIVPVNTAPWASVNTDKQLAELQARLASDPEWHGGRYYGKAACKTVLTNIRGERRGPLSCFSAGARRHHLHRQDRSGAAQAAERCRRRRGRDFRGAPPARSRGQPFQLAWLCRPTPLISAV
jgi:hypothetical protein